MRGYFGVAIYHPKTQVNIGTLWRTANILGASFLATIGRKYNHQCSDNLKTPRHIPLFHYDDFVDFKKHLPSECSLVGIEILKQAINLNGFEHPKRACYLLGSEDNGLPQFVIDQCHFLVQLQGKFCFNVAVAGSIILYHRVYLKGGSK